jgi:Lrp/AsnC family transcriptional regulator
MDKLDAKILTCCRATASSRPPRSPTGSALQGPRWRRIQKLQADGVIRHRVVLLDAHALNVGTTVFVTLKTGNHSEAFQRSFVRAVRDIPK